MKVSGVYLIITLLINLLAGSAQAQEVSKAFLEGDYQKAMTLQAISETDFLYQGLALEMYGKELDAIQVFEDACKKFPNSDAAPKKLAALYKKRAMFNDALTIYTSLLAKDSSDVSLSLSISDIYVSQERNKIAVDLLKGVIKSGHESSAIYERLAFAYKGIGDDEMVLWAYTQALRLDPKNNAIAAQVIKYNYSLKAFKTTIERVDEVFERDSSYLVCYKYKGLSLSHQKKFKEAIPYLEHYLKTGSRQKIVLFHKAYCHYAMHQYWPVPRLLKEYYKGEDPKPEVDFIYGISLRETGDTLGAIPYLSRAIDGMQPPFDKLGTFYFELANTYRINAKYNEAVENYQLGYETDTAAQKQCLFFKASVLTNDLNRKKDGLTCYKEFLAHVGKKENIKKEEFTVSLREVAERKVKSLTEELFFENETE